MTVHAERRVIHHRPQDLYQLVANVRAYPEFLPWCLAARIRLETDHDLEADLIIGAVLIPGASAPKLISRDLLAQLKPGTVMVDVAIDQGGCFETSKATTHADPTYVVDDVVHYCVANMPGAVARTASAPAY